jgi:HAMP domain-containing protein
MNYRLLLLLPIAIVGALSFVIPAAGDYELRDILADVRIAPLSGGSPALAATAAETSGGTGGVQIQAVFYGVVVVCALLVALQALVSLLHARREEHALAVREGSSPEVRPQMEFSAPVAAPRHLARVSAAVHTAPVSVASAASGPRLNFHYQIGVSAKMVLALCGTVLGFGLIVVALVYFTLGAPLRRHVMHRLEVIAMNASDAVAPYLSKKDSRGLQARLQKQADRPELAYVIVENQGKQIVAHSLAALPDELRRSPTGPTAGQAQRTLTFNNALVDELIVPVLDGRRGRVRVGVWRSGIDAEVRQTLLQMVQVIGVVVITAIAAAIFLVRRITRPITKLVAAAKAISSGELAPPAPHITDSMEVGALSRAFERMRASVKAALSRLG